MSKLLRALLRTLLFSHHIVEEGGGGGAADIVDRGDDFDPTDDADDAAAIEKAAADKAAEDKAAAAKALKDAGGDEDADLTDEEKEAAAAAAADKEKADKAKTKDTRIPLNRHKEILAKEREQREALEKQLAQFQGGKSLAATNEAIQKDETKLLELEAEHAKLVVDGEHAKAATVMGTIRKLERGIIETKASLNTQAAEARAVERVRYDTTLDRLEQANPAMNPDHEDFDEEKVAEILDLKSAYQSRGYTPAQALQKAVKLILPPATAKQEAAIDTKAKVDKDDAAAAAKKLAAERKEAAVKKNLDAAGKQPASTKGVGADSDKAGGGPLTGEAVLRLRYDDFIKLDEATLAKHRGDVI